jgi:HEAT repeat protein
MAAWALSEIADPRAAPAMRAALPRSSEGEALWLSIGLAKLRDKEAASFIAALFPRVHWRLRARLAEALAEIGDPRAIEPIERALADMPWWRWRWRRRMRRALRLLKRQAREGI